MKILRRSFAATKYLIFALLIPMSFAFFAENTNDDLTKIQAAAEPEAQDDQLEVQTFIFDARDFSGTYDVINIPEITQDVLDNDLIICYLTSNGNNWVTVPCPYDVHQFNVSVYITTSVGYLSLDYGDIYGKECSVKAGDLQKLKVSILKSKKSNKNQNEGVLKNI